VTLPDFIKRGFFVCRDAVMRPVVGVQLTLWLLRMVLLWVGVKMFLFQSRAHGAGGVPEGILILLSYALFALFVFGISFVRRPLTFGILCLSVVLIPMLPWVGMLLLSLRKTGWDLAVGCAIPAGFLSLLAVGLWTDPHFRFHFRCSPQSRLGMPPQKAASPVTDFGNRHHEPKNGTSGSNTP
jgi:hypothetical protein